ncbi:unannotated protein [freshwater metagenome]|uniref:Unannotated protein n=1 Tax=freshwater metagenome TaxID=449393 RepID=A0A6J6UUD6_9ZZZZ|nr:galactose mutarotase [Actinomycetota bacterium]MSV71373.1 galactose mutarotase [Actinomycetota bacterium]MSW14309.1 galactose mutarotase [Actinomycetota bacterium]MSX47525.1 galactose mutarotase [Actinomycetota bacterium]MSX91723.1 galactose mutarotase [Actinomycetota bacterium]
MKKETLYLISHGEYTSEISTMGAALTSLSFAGSNLIEKRTHPRYFSGEILAPWPNRIEDGKYSFRDLGYVLPINEVTRNTALHGLVFDKPWQVISQEQDQITLGITIDDHEIYPGILELEIHYKLEDLGLLSTLTATNCGDSAIPYGASTHPYISVPGLESVNDFMLQLGASHVLLTDDERYLPTDLVDVVANGFDFRSGRIIGEQFINHAFLQDPDLPREILVTSQSGKGVLISFSENAKWIQIHTADRDGGEDSRRVLAVEPMTCPPDAFNSGIDLIELLPGESHELSWRIKVI